MLTLKFLLIILAVILIFAVAVIIGVFIFMFKKMFGLESEEDTEYGEAPHNRAEVVRGFRTAQTVAAFMAVIDLAGDLGLCGTEEDKAGNRAFRRLRHEFTQSQLRRIAARAEPGGRLYGRASAYLPKDRFGIA